MRLPLQFRSMSVFSRNIKDFSLETPAFSVIQPVLATNYEKQNISSELLTKEIKSQSVPSYVYGEDENSDVEKDIITYSNDDIEAISQASQIAAHCVKISRDLLQPGTTTLSLNNVLHDEIISKDAYPSVLGFKGFPKSISTSVNNVACHGLPDKRPLENGDIVSVDVTVYKNGFHGVCGATYVIGNAKNNPIVRYLRSVAEECLYKGISACRPGSMIIDIGADIGKFARKRHIKVIPTLTGHGIGKYFHSKPDIFHVMNNYPGTMIPGMVLTVCPCITEGNVSIRVLEDNLTVVTRDNSRTAQFGHTVLITEYGAEILSQ